MSHAEGCKMQEQAMFERAAKIYDIYRDRIKHEDSFINHRTNWMLALHAAAAYGIGALLTKTQAIACTSLLGVHFSAEIALSAILTLLAVGTAAFAFHSIGTALQCVVDLHNHFQEHTKQWLQANAPPAVGSLLPPPHRQCDTT